jgi:isopentenyl diphosphate isomerase/L-lactate dehydrogenase-like FMN-dependent dehydrogenase
VAIEKITEGNFKNLSRTTVKDVNYRKCIDRSILAVQSCAENYQEAIRKAIRQATKKGVQVEYGGNRTRRLDTAVRMNVLDGVRQMQIEVNKICGEEFGADGVEIDAHGLCAKDHITIQGKRMSEKQYRQRVLDRKDVRNIGSNNCQHMLKAIVMGVGKPAYSKEQLDEMKKYTEEPLDTLGGKNRRDASNEMRVLETRARECKEQLIAFKNDPKEKARYERRLDRTMAKYKDLTKKSGLKPQYDRMKIE